jgi:hypothetical protein
MSGPTWVQAELELGDDAEVAAAATERPEEVRVRVLVGAYRPPARGDEFSGDQRVDRQTELPHEIANAAAERQPADTGVRHLARRYRESVLLCGLVELAEQGAAADAGTARLRIDDDMVDRREVDDQAAVARRVPGRAVPAAADRERQVLCARELDRRRDVLGVVAAGDRQRAPVDGSAPDATRLVVLRVVGLDQLTRETSGSQGSLERRVWGDE